VIKKQPLPVVVEGVGHLAAAAQLLEKRSLEGDGHARGFVEVRGVPADVLGPALDGHRRLAGGRHAIVQREGTEVEAAPALDAQPTQAGRRQDGGLGLALGDFFEAGLHVAADLLKGGFGKEATNLGPAPRAAGGNGGRLRHARAGDENVVGGLPGQEPRQGQPLRHSSRQVLGAVHGQIGPSVEQGFLELLGEKPLSALPLQRPGPAAVPRRRQLHDAKGGFGKGGLQAGDAQARLGEGQGALARGHGNFAGGTAHASSRGAAREPRR